MQLFVLNLIWTQTKVKFPMPLRQQTLFDTDDRNWFNIQFPSTRYQGSKRKLTDWLWSNVKDLPFSTGLDVFGGTGAVSHLFKRHGKQVTYNDTLKFNWQIGVALIQNAETTITAEDLGLILDRQTNIAYPNFIYRTFSDIYFTDAENQWLDQIVFNIDHFIKDPIKQALARFALFQSCIIKRPYNLFHRANLYMRHAAVERSFGNKHSWDTAFEIHFRLFIAEANAAVFDNHCLNSALNLDAGDTPIGSDLVYLDPPYLNAKGVGVNYYDFYHFLEGLVNYDTWGSQIDFKSRHKRLIPKPSPWMRPNSILSAFETVIDRHQNSIIVISYRDNGVPSRKALIDLLKYYKPTVTEVVQDQRYVLATQASREMLLIGR